MIDLAHAADKTIAVVMGGGAGTRLHPLTAERSKPAVPLAGKYRLVDIPISNCLNSGLRRIYVLTQFNSLSLHQHITETYKFDSFHYTPSFVQILAAEQTPTTSSWYEGTADAVRKNMTHYEEQDYEYALILSGDQLYNLDYRSVMTAHLQSEADITIATLPVSRQEAPGFGIMETDAEGGITSFVEKPSEEAVLEKLRLTEASLKEHELDPTEERYLASMGIYLFKRKALEEVLHNDLTDFGKHIIPQAIQDYKVQSYVFKGYWEDIGTIRSFFEANLDLAADVPSFNFFDPRGQVYTHARFLPASKINSAQINHAIVSDGCVLSGAILNRCIIGIRSIIGAGTSLKDVVMMGADRFDSELPASDHNPPLGIGNNCRIERAIIDKNVRIGNDVVITPDGKPDHVDGSNFCLREGIVVIPKGSVIPDGTWI
ncbi:MAG: glucose-1-phosphate adenylyltransferase [Verrucomicrobiota bacterium]